MNLLPLFPANPGKHLRRGETHANLAGERTRAWFIDSTRPQFEVIKAASFMVWRAWNWSSRRKYNISAEKREGERNGGEKGERSRRRWPSWPRFLIRRESTCICSGLTADSSFSPRKLRRSQSSRGPKRWERERENRMFDRLTRIYERKGLIQKIQLAIDLRS